MFWKNSTGKKLEAMHTLLQQSFSKVKNDIHSVMQWVQYLNQKLLEQQQLVYQQQQTIKELSEYLSLSVKSPEEINKIIESNYPYERLLNSITALNYKIQDLETKFGSLQSQKPAQLQPSQQLEQNLNEVIKRLEKLEGKKLSIKEKIMKRLTKNSKAYVMGAILGYIKKYESISATKLKEIVVDEQAFCSKSSFYRILEDIEVLDEIGAVKKGKEKQYFYKIEKNF